MLAETVSIRSFLDEPIVFDSVMILLIISIITQRPAGGGWFDLAVVDAAGGFLLLMNP